MLYTTPDLFIAEALNAVTAVATYWLLAEKNRNGWISYLISSFALIYLLAFKESWMTVINQSMMAILAIKNYFYFHREGHKVHRYFEWLTLGVFGVSLLWMNGWDGKGLSELLLWVAIIGKTLLLGKKNIGGWYFQIVQQALSIVFGLYREIYLYVAKGAFFALQGVYGYWRWRNGGRQD